MADSTNAPNALLSALSGLSTDAANIYTAVRGSPRTTTPAAPKTNYTPWLIGGGLVAALLVVLLMLRK